MNVWWKGGSEMGVKQKILPVLWFGRRAEEAARFYTGVFRDSRLGNSSRYGEAGAKVSEVREGSIMTMEFEIGGHRFMGLNGEPLFRFNPSISFLVACETRSEVDSFWVKLSKGGGPPLMQLGKYPFSERYGWTQDTYGLSWQLMLMREREMRQKITPTLMFVGEQYGNAETAVTLYTSIFGNSAVGEIMRYGKDEEPDEEGAVKHAGFTLEGQQFAAVDSALEHNFSFNEAISFMVQCRNQEEIDYYWGKLTADGGHEGICGWLKDRFGVSWQITPAILADMLRDADREKAERVTRAFLKMKKFDIEELEKAIPDTQPHRKPRITQT
jgi:predicted 3-demethylubiquinone-9 3-methyltransferase (glyoxalase superfamily)